MGTSLKDATIRVIVDASQPRRENDKAARADRRSEARRPRQGGSARRGAVAGAAAAGAGRQIVGALAAIGGLAALESSGPFLAGLLRSHGGARAILGAAGITPESLELVRDVSNLLKKQGANLAAFSDVKQIAVARDLLTKDGKVGAGGVLAGLEEFAAVRRQLTELDQKRQLEADRAIGRQFGQLSAADAETLKRFVKDAAVDLGVDFIDIIAKQLLASSTFRLGVEELVRNAFGKFAH